MRYWLVALSTVLSGAFGEYVRKTLIAAGLLVVGLSLGVFGCFGLLMALFFALADVTQFIGPSVFVGVVALLLALIAVIEARVFLKRKT